MNKPDILFCVIVEKGSATTQEGDGSNHVRYGYIVLDNWFSSDRKQVMTPKRLTNSVPNELPKIVVESYFDINDKVTNEDMGKRFKRFPFPLKVGFIERTLNGMY
jgi:hypothetical protein